MQYGVTRDGFVRKRLPEIRHEIVETLTTRLRAMGYQRAIETRPDSVIGQLIDTFSEREATLWEVAEGVYFAMYPPSASGVSLDHAVSYSGAKRQTELPARCYVLLYGEDGTIVPRHSQIRHRSTRTLWDVASETVISRAIVAEMRVTILEVLPNTRYAVLLDGVAFEYQSNELPEAGDIVSGLANALIASGRNVESGDGGVRVYTDGTATFAASVTEHLTIARAGTPALVQTIDGSSEHVGVGDLSEIVTQVPGWIGVSNIQPGSPGRKAENDAALRAAYKSGIFRLGAATLPSLGPNIKDLVSGVLAVRVFENDTDDLDIYGRPPHSVHYVVDGGLDQDIGEAILATEAAGIDTFGDTVVTVIDSEGTPQELRFDRPHKRYMWVRIRIRILPPEEADFPSDGYGQVKKGLVGAGRVLDIGEDVVRQKLFGGIYKTPGISEVDLRLACSASPLEVPEDIDYKSENVEIRPFERAVFDESRVEVGPWI